MAKQKKGGTKIKQRGMPPSHHLKKSHKKRAEKAPWSDPLLELNRGGNRR